MQKRILGRFHQSIKLHEYLSELLTSAVYPHISVTEERRHLAYESILLYEVITKRIPALDELRKGLASVKVSQTKLLDLLGKLP